MSVLKGSHENHNILSTDHLKHCSCSLQPEGLLQDNVLTLGCWEFLLKSFNMTLPKPTGRELGLMKHGTMNRSIGHFSWATITNYFANLDWSPLPHGTPLTHRRKRTRWLKTDLPPIFHQLATYGPASCLNLTGPFDHSAKHASP